MLSYRHAFHAGNHADVLKHYIYSLVLDYFNQKPKPYWVIDTHAGAGMYALDDDFAQTNVEFEDGILKLIQTQNLPESLNGFANLIKSFNPNQSLDYYPGSPKIAAHYLRHTDKLRLFEMHPHDCEILREHLQRQGRQVRIEMQNGFDGLKALLPPPTKRGIIIIDPPYEVKQDYQQVVDSIQQSLKRFATGTYLIWYPLLSREEPTQMIAQLQALGIRNWLDVTLSVQIPSKDGFGMFGSGVFIINPPWTLPKTLAADMPTLTTLLALDDGATFTLDYNIN